MKIASPSYLAELAETELASQLDACRRDMSRRVPKGETEYYGSTGPEPGVEVEYNYRRVAEGLEVEIVVYQPGDEDEIVASVTRKGVVPW